jgi:predicted component of type VI protein secretion system
LLPRGIKECKTQRSTLNHKKMGKQAKGGNVKTRQAKARVDIADKSALVAVDSPNAGARPKVFKANTINDAVSNLKVSFKTKLKKLDGTTCRETIAINSLDDFEEPVIVEQSEALRQQKQQMTFLHDFQNELKTNPGLREELQEILDSEKKGQLIDFLKRWAKQFQKPEMQLMQLLKSKY